MRLELFGYDLKIAKRMPAGAAGASSVPSSRGGWFRVLEPFAGAWQRNLDSTAPDNILTFSAAYSCIALIASDISKMRVMLTELNADGIWNETSSTAFSPVLRKPNHYQNRIQFYQYWTVSKLINGNTYVLKQRDQRGVVIALYILDPTRVQPLVAPNGDVYYQIGNDDLSRTDAIVAPAREVIHDVQIPTLYHPLVGVSPITACGLAALQGLKVQGHSTQFFANGANPGGVLTAPGTINDITAKRLEDKWNAEYGGANAGKVAVLGDGLKYEAMSMSAVDAQLIEQLKWTAEDVCTAFRVPAYMIGVGPAPSYNNVEALTLQYYAQCLQSLIECIELCLDEGLGLDQVKDRVLGTEFDTDQLLRMDSATRIKAAGEAMKSGVSPNEVRKTYHNLGPVKGGESPYLQQQNYSLEALAKRDGRPDPFAKATAPTRPAANDVPDDEAVDEKHLDAYTSAFLHRQFHQSPYERTHAE